MLTTGFKVLTASLFLFCRSVSAGEAERSGYFCDDIKKPFFAAVPGGGGLFSPQRPMALQDSFYMPKPGGLKRVFILGESVAVILGPGKMAVNRASSGRLPAGVPPGSGGGPEIINCGMSGYAGSRIYGVFKEVLRYSPDLLVVLSGNNEGLSEQQCPGLDFELRRREFNLLERYYSVKYGPQEARKKASIKMHADMLAKMARAAKKAGVPVIFCTLPANVKDMPPRQAPPLENERFSSGYRLFYDKDYQAAAGEFRLGLGADPQDAFFNFYLAKALEKLGKPGEAGPYFYNALEFSGDMTRAGRERNEAVRKMAAAENACVADLEKFFYRIPPDGLTGFSEFMDGLHWRPSYNKAVWEEIFRSAGACGIKGYGNFRASGSGTWPDLPRDDARKRLSYAVAWLEERGLNEGSMAEFSYLREKAPELLKEAAVSAAGLEKIFIRNFWTIGSDMRLDALFPLLLESLAETERRAGDYSGALSLCDRAAALRPDDAAPRLERAQILAGLGKTAEAENEFFTLAENYSEARYKARALRSAYGFGAASAPRSARKLSYENLNGEMLGVDSRINSCFILAGEKKDEQALQACQDAVYAVSSSTGGKPAELQMLGSDASLESYRLLTALGRAEEAAETLFWTVANAPAAWPKLAEARALLEKAGGKKAPAAPPAGGTP